MTDASKTDPQPIRLQKFLAKAGICSRREGENYIAAGRVRVNNEIVTTAGIKVDPEKDSIMVDNKPVWLKERPVYIMLNKPKGYISSCRHGEEAIVLDLVDVKERVFPVGRLDKDSTGLLIMTNDGRIHHRLAHPSFDHEKEYVVEARREIADSDLKRLARGIVLDGKITRPAIVTHETRTRFRITLREGRKRQIRRMVEAIGNEVRGLHRVRMAGLKLEDLAEGKWRYLSSGEIDELMALLRD